IRPQGAPGRRRARRGPLRHRGVPPQLRHRRPLRDLPAPRGLRAHHQPEGRRAAMTEFLLNGQPVTVADDHPHLLSALRDELGVTSPKDGCAPEGQCGCCLVLIDGKARTSCTTALERVEGAAITTLEGLDPGEVDRMATAFAATGALQCGFCTPGIMM